MKPCSLVVSSVLLVPVEIFVFALGTPAGAGIAVAGDAVGRCIVGVERLVVVGAALVEDHLQHPEAGLDRGTELLLAAQLGQDRARLPDRLGETLVAFSFGQQVVVLATVEPGVDAQIDLFGEALVDLRALLFNLAKHSLGCLADQKAWIVGSGVGLHVAGIHDQRLTLLDHPLADQHLVEGVEGLALTTVAQQAGPEVTEAAAGDAGVVPSQAQGRLHLQVVAGGILHGIVREVLVALEDQGDRHLLGAARRATDVGVHPAPTLVGEQLVRQGLEPHGERVGLE